MYSSLSYKNWLEHLQYLSPQTGVVYVGAGTGSSLSSHVNDLAKTVVLIEADESYTSRLQQLSDLKQNWILLTETLNSQVEEKTFYYLSNTAESSVVAPSYLNSIWKNLSIVKERSVITTTLADVLQTVEVKLESLNWLVIDCLPALPVMQGAGEYNEAWDVISARVIIDESIGGGQGLLKKEVDAYLFEMGYRCIAVEEERQPAIARALYVMDWRKIQAKVVSELQGQNQQLTQQLTQSKAEQDKLSAEHTKTVSELQGQNQQLTQQLTQSKAEQDKLSAEHTKTVSELQGQNKQLTQQLTQSKAEQDKLSAEHTKTVSELQSQNAELLMRKSLLQDEILRAEAQIELIKDVLLREPGL